MLKIKYPILLLILFWSNVNLLSQNLSPASSTISLLTASPGEELYTTFGHSAIRIQDTLSGSDIVYNYGIFNFRTPNFYQKFIRGKLMYQLGRQQLNSFLDVYTRENRKVTERVMNLTDSQKAAVINFLAQNYLPENREYLYDFFYDNCASRIRDVVEIELGAGFEYSDTSNRKVTFRQLLDEYLITMPWADFGIDLILGLKADKRASFRHQMFLPDYLESNLNKGKVNYKPLFSESTTLLPYQFQPNTSVGFFTPLVVMILLLLGTALFTFLVQNKILQNTFDVFLFLVLGMMGCVFLFMWFGTDHQACHQNVNMLWANPLYLFLAPFALIKNWRWFWWSILRISGALLLLFPIFPQQYHLAFIPIFLLIGLRCWYRVFKH